MGEPVTVVGIDVGITGAVAILDHHGHALEIFDMPAIGNEVSAALLVERFACTWAEHGRARGVTVERLHAMPAPVGSKANFSKGHSYGIVLGVLAAMDIPIYTPTPAVWKKDMGVTKDKDGARAAALKLWPEQAEMLKRKKDADRAEALLLAEHGRRLLVERGAL